MVHSLLPRFAVAALGCRQPFLLANVAKLTKRCSNGLKNKTQQNEIGPAWSRKTLIFAVPQVRDLKDLQVPHLRDQKR